MPISDARRGAVPTFPSGVRGSRKEGSDVGAPGRGLSVEQEVKESSQAADLATTPGLDESFSDDRAQQRDRERIEWSSCGALLAAMCSGG